MITVVTLNWARPNYTLINLHRYASYRIVKHVFCFNNGAPLPNPRELPKKCVIVEATRDLGLYSRLALASLARTEAIFHTDDDLLVPEQTINSLYSSWSRAQLSCHGTFGRIARPAYQQGDVFGRVEIVLTRAVVCSRRVNNVALTATERLEDLVAEPHGNGEDIVLSFAAMALSRVPNFAYRLPIHEYQIQDNLAIHRRWTHHFEHRRRVASRCRKLFLL